MSNIPMRTSSADQALEAPNTIASVPKPPVAEKVAKGHTKGQNGPETECFHKCYGRNNKVQHKINMTQKFSCETKLLYHNCCEHGCESNRWSYDVSKKA